MQLEYLLSFNRHQGQQGWMVMNASTNYKNCSGEELGTHRKGSLTFNKKIRKMYMKQRWHIQRTESLEAINL